MAVRRRFRILTPGGRLSVDRFFISVEQPCFLDPGSVLLVNEQTGVTTTVLDTQLFPAEAVGLPPLGGDAARACLEQTAEEPTRRYVGHSPGGPAPFRRRLGVITA
jgi:hypothetical protein